MAIHRSRMGSRETSCWATRCGPPKGTPCSGPMRARPTLGWTPCIGPILAAILVLAETQDTVLKGILLLAIYSLGLAVPFLLTSLGVDRFLAFYGRFRRHLHTVEVISGVLLIAVGVLIFLNNLKLLSGYLSFLNRFAL